MWIVFSLFDFEELRVNLEAVEASRERVVG
jgi:hypothetical protein